MYFYRSCLSHKILKNGSEVVLLFPSGKYHSGIYFDTGHINDIDIFILHAVDYSLKYARQYSHVDFKTKETTAIGDKLRETTLNNDFKYRESGGISRFRIMALSEFEPNMHYCEFYPSQRIYDNLLVTIHSKLYDGKHGDVLAKNGTTTRSLAFEKTFVFCAQNLRNSIRQISVNKNQIILESVLKEEDAKNDTVNKMYIGHVPTYGLETITDIVNEHNKQISLIHTFDNIALANLEQMFLSK